MSKTDQYEENSDIDLEMRYDASIEKAQVLIEAAKWNHAKLELNKALEADPESAIAHYYMSVCHYNTAELDKAKQEAKIALGQYSDFDGAHWMLANIALQKRKYSEGLKEINAALKIEPTEVDYYITKSALFLDSNKLQQALETADEALSLDPGNESAGSIRTMALTALGRHDEADAQSKAIMAASPDSALAWYQRGLQLFAIGNFDEARHAALESLRIDPADHDAEMLLLRVMSTQKGFFSLYWRWIQWLFSFTPNVRGMILIGLFVFMRVIRGLGERNPSLMPLILPVIIIWIFFCLYTWTAAPMFRFAVRKGWIK